MNAKKLIAAAAVLVMAIAAFTIVSCDDLSGADDPKIVEIKGDFTSQMTYTVDQKVVVVDDLNIINGGQITILGDFVVNSGVTVTIEGNNSQLMILGNATIDGDVVSKVAEGLSIQPGRDVPQGVYSVVINGNVTALGDTSGTIAEDVIYFEPYLYDGVDNEIIINGTVTVGTNADATMYYPIFTEKSKLVVFGDICGTVCLAGYAYFDGSVGEGENFEIYFVNANAVIDVVSVKSVYDTAIWITDESMYAYTYGGYEYYVDEIPDYASEESKLAIDEDFTKLYDNWIYLTNVTNVKITEKVTTAIKHNEIDSGNYMVASIGMIISALDSSKKVETIDGELGYFGIQDGGAVFLESMTIADIDFTVGDEKATLTIVGDVTFLLSNLVDGDSNLTQVFTVDTYGELNVTGQLIIKNDDIKGPGAINAAHYTVKNDDNTEDNYYTSLKKAIENGAKTIDMKGQLIVKEDITVPAGVTVKIADIEYKESDGIADEDYAVIIEEGATLTIADGATYKMPLDDPETEDITEVYAMKVDGSFKIENIDSGITLGADNQIFADVLLKDGTVRLYTNIYDAVAQAKAGAEIEAYNPAFFETVKDEPAVQAIVIDEDLTIPAGVQFSDYNAADSKEIYIYVENGYILTIAGKIIIHDEHYLVAGENGWNDAVSKPKNGEMKDFSVIAIGPQGVIEFQAISGFLSEGLYVYTDKLVAGAYYATEDKKASPTQYYYIANVEPALNGILDTYNRQVYIAGAVTLDNIKATGAEGKTIEIYFAQGFFENTEITMKNFTFAYAWVEAESGVKLSGDIGTSTGRIILDEAIAGYYDKESDTYGGIFACEEIFIDDAYNFRISGYISSNKETSVSGKVYAIDIVYGYGKQNYETEEEMVLGADIKDFRFTIPAGSQVIVKANNDYTVKADFTESEIVVAGTLTVTNSGELDAMLVSVLGTLDVQKVDGKSGYASIKGLIAGGSSDSFDSTLIDIYATSMFTNTDGNASIIGDGAFHLAVGILFNGATVSAPVLKDWMESGDYGSTEFYVDGKLWMTGYVGEDVKAPIVMLDNYKDYRDIVNGKVDPEYRYFFVPALSNVVFKTWQTYDEKTKTYKDIVPDLESVGRTMAPAVFIGQYGYEKVYASIDKEIYNIVITADVGIDDVFIDGKIMVKDQLTNQFSDVVAAGSHKITYTLANGYSGSAVITSIDGKELVGQGLSFTVDDNKYDDVADKMVITISGIQKSGIDTDPETHPEKAAGGLTVTEILLIVVVIIMAIMAVVLILRLNRS